MVYSPVTPSVTRFRSVSRPVSANSIPYHSHVHCTAWRGPQRVIRSLGLHSLASRIFHLLSHGFSLLWSEEMYFKAVKLLRK